MNSFKKPIYLCMSFIALLAGCAAPQQKPDADNAIYWPEPPAPPRFVHVATLISETSIKPVTMEDRFRKALTGEREVPRIFSKPFGVAAKNGLVVVGDTVQRRCFIFNLQRKKVYPLGVAGREGVLAKPLGIAIGANSEIYVADASAKRVYVYDAFGMYLRSIGERGELDRPTDVAVTPDGKRVYVVDTGGIDSLRHRVVAFSAEGEKLFEFGRRGLKAGEFNLPTQVSVAPNGEIIVLDAGNFRVQVFTAEGRYQRSWGRVGRAFGDFARPRGLAVDADGNVYVSDTLFRNVQVFNPKGELLLAIGGDQKKDKPGTLAMPAGVAIDELQNVYIVDQFFKKVEVLHRLQASEIEAIVTKRKGAG